MTDRTQTETPRQEARASAEAGQAPHPTHPTRQAYQTHQTRPARPARRRRPLASLLGLASDQATHAEILERIESGAQVTGSNMYFLVLAIFIASVGLNTNSTAVVIGAMLISPLMGVIIGIAYGIANFRINMLRRLAPRLLFQVLVSVITSTIYFTLSPIDTFSGELVARTNPTIWDVLIATCGGFAAIIANTRKSTISNVVPGAAIATALMPPLCTMGYCISQGRLLQAGTAGYLFLINAIFICLSSVLALRAMGVTTGRNFLSVRKNRVLLACVIAFTVIPSAFLGYQTVRNMTVTSQAEKFIQQELSFDNTQVVTSNVDQQSRTIKVALIGTNVSDETIAAARDALPAYGLSNFTLDVTQTVVQQGITASQLEEILAQEAEKNAQASSSAASDAETLLSAQAAAQSLQATTARDVIALYPNVVSAGFLDLYGAGSAASDAGAPAAADERAGATDRADADGADSATSPATADADAPSYTLLLVVREELGAEELANLKSWVDGKFGTEVRVVQVTQESAQAASSLVSTDATE